MPVPKQLVGVKGDECICGRRMTVRHCPSCGSSRIYARMDRHHVMLDGSVKKVDVEYRCQTCGHLFIEDERQFCEAPPVGAVLAAQKVRALAEAKKQGEYLRPADQKLAEALQEVTKEPTPQTQAVYDDTALKNVWFSYKRAWADLKFQNMEKGITTTPSVAEFIEKHVPESGLPQQYIDKILEWQRAEK